MPSLEKRTPQATKIDTSLYILHQLDSHNMVSLELEARLDNLLSTAQAETADIDIFAPLPESEECPICLLPLPLDLNETSFNPCCGKTICFGCIYKNMLREKTNGDPSKIGLCAFCRQPIIHDKNYIKRIRKLMKNNNPESYLHMAERYRSGKGVLQSDTKSVEMYIRAAELGNANAFGYIGDDYRKGVVVEQSASKSLEFFELSAKKGSIQARRELARFHGVNGDMQVCMKHLKVIASAGDQDAMGDLMRAYKEKLIAKEELTHTLRACQASQNEMKSEDRDEAKLFNKETDSDND